MNQKKEFLIFKNNLRIETIDDLLEDRKILLKEEYKYRNYIKIIENEIKKRLNKYGIFSLK